MGTHDVYPVNLTQYGPARGTCLSYRFMLLFGSSSISSHPPMLLHQKLQRDEVNKRCSALMINRYLLIFFHRAELFIEILIALYICSSKLL
ncbi:hypothetical protein BKA82DRAFT_991796 [Pisolithus tinctorius]|uniref:Uncharacterized protein n=1 Tax=Pisolithus tinctorius Marx 270 TaxID=870435 RepID=A0A0C3KZY3_PISTI|nr:hypothetical protein BKA82DRAFT_991796 [Pisolithus tinctorius]KIO15097.1 hypothetical protein M404DRAFT_991796 [Pisolithus tinctorius Marx 270]